MVNPQMEENPQLDGLDVQDYPTNEVLDGTVQQVTRGERQEFFENSEYGDDTDTLVELKIEVSHGGETYNVNEYLRQYETVTTRHKLGQFIKRYGSPEVGQQVKVDFDGEGQSSVVI